jgi:signal peptidase I
VVRLRTGGGSGGTGTETFVGDRRTDAPRPCTAAARRSEFRRVHQARPGAAPSAPSHRPAFFASQIVTVSSSRSRKGPQQRPQPPATDATAAASPAQPEEGASPRGELKGTLRGGRDAGRKKGPQKLAPENGGPLEGLKSILIAVLLFFVIRTFIVTAYSIPSESMERTLLVGDYLMANNAVFGATLPFTDVKLPAVRDPRAGEIVVFRPTYNEPQIDVVKRVVGVPGDTLQMANGVLYRNGDRVAERYASFDPALDDAIPLEGFGLMDPNVRPEAYGAKNHLPLLLPSVDARAYRPTRNTWGPIVVPAGHYWLMGDNRDQSLDSRFMGPVPRRVIRGKPLFIYYSFDRRADAPFPAFITAARWKRLGTPIH